MKLKLALAAAAVGLPMGQAEAQFTVYTNRAAFEAAAGALESVNFNAGPTQVLGTPAAGAFSQAFGNVTLAGNANGDHVAVAAGSNPGNIDGTNFFYFSERNPANGSYSGNGGTGPAFTATFSTATTAFGFDWRDTDATDSYRLTINGTTFATPPFVAGNVGAGFFGVVATGGVTFTQAAFSQNQSGGVVDPFGIDNLAFTAQPATTAPEPTTLVLSGTAMLLTLGYARLRRRDPAA